MTALYQISYGPVCAGLLADASGKIISCAPILRQWVLGRNIAEIKRRCQLAGYLIEQLDEEFILL